MEAVIEAAFFIIYERDKGAAILADISQGRIEFVFPVQQVIILKSCDSGIIWMKMKEAQFFEVIIKERYLRRIRSFRYRVWYR